MTSSPVPTFVGHIASTHDALLLFEACLTGSLNHVARRPHDGERKKLILSGNVFIYEEHSSGIKRWTDGVAWSPSRILGNFLVYRELERPFPPGEKKRATKRHKRSPGISKSQDPVARPATAMPSYGAGGPPSFDTTATSSLSKETERSLIGSLVDSYGFKENGLVKKTVSVSVAGVSHHLVSYYTVADIMNNKFITPSKDPRFQHTTPRNDLLTKQNFRTPIDEVDNLDRLEDRSMSSCLFTRGAFDMTYHHSMVTRPLPLPLPLPSPQIAYTASANPYGTYGLSPNTGAYTETLPLNAASTGYPAQFTAPAPTMFTATPKVDGFEFGTYRPPRYHSAANLGSDTSRAQMPSAAPGFPRRSSTYDQGSSISSGMSAMSTTSADPKYTLDPGYPSNELYGGLKDTNSPREGFERVLPNPVYDRSQASSYASLENPSLKENNWPVGNTSAGHGHYMPTQQPWGGGEST